MSSEPENLVLQILREMRAEMASMRADMAKMQAQMDTSMATKAEMNSLRADLASDLVLSQAKQDKQHKHTHEQLAGVRRTVMDIYSSVIGHGSLITELEDRIRRVEQHLNLPSTGAH